MRRAVLGGLGLLAAIGAAGAVAWSSRGAGPGAGGIDAPPTVVLIVLDTIRADHLSACGYERPTSPFLASLAENGVLRCDAIAAASWTVASHASMFTGLPPDQHGTLFREGGERLHNNIHVRPLEERFDTIAERFRDAGYATVFLSGNPSLHEGSGLTQGFLVHDTKAPDGSWLRAGKLQRAVKSALAEIEPGRPLFLVVNVFDAHDPWPSAEPEIDWAPRHERVVLQHDVPSSPYVRFHRGELPEEERAAYLATVTDAYDVGLWRADKALKGLHKTLEEGGWLDRPYRLVVTADHGELLGEHDRLRHGGNVYEGNLRVPLLWIEPGAEPRLDGLVGGAEIHDIVLRGARSAPDEVWAFTEPAQMHPSPGVWGVARYTEATKVVATTDGTWSVDLGADPKEATLAPAEAPAALSARLDSLRAVAAEPFTPSGLEDEEALRALGYVE